MIINDKNTGRAWCRTAEGVLVQECPQDAIGQAIPYGINDPTTNRGFVIGAAPPSARCGATPYHHEPTGKMHERTVPCDARTPPRRI
ncbi:hypothetical protein FW320_10670 [Azospirillum sp. Vi22]|nr:hypothetical protein [Azospirillum baldaniorum]